MSDKQKAKNKKPIYFFDSLLIWLFGDVAFTVLPIFIIAVINLALKVSFKEFLLLPEWSFAAIVLLGLSIKHSIELKVEYQRDTSFKLYVGTQIQILLLITAVLSLSLVELRAKGIEMDLPFLTTLQVALFVSGLILLFNPILLKQEVTEKRNNLPDELYKGEYFSYLEDRLRAAIDNIGYFEYAAGKCESIELKIGSDFVASNTWNEEKSYKLESMLNRLEQHVQEAKKMNMTLRQNLLQQVKSPSDTAA